MAIGAKVTYADTTTQVRTVVPEIDLLSPKDFPTLKLIGGGDAERPTLNTLDVPCESVKYEWMEDTDPPLQTTNTAAVADNTTTSVTMGNVANVNEGQIWQFADNGEQIWVSAVTGSNPVTVVRGYGGTTAASHLISQTMYLVGRAHREGAAAPTPRYQFPTMPFNYVQSFVDAFELSAIEQSIKRYSGDLDAAIEYETSLRTRLLMKDVSRALFFGQKVLMASGVAGSFGGIKTFIPAGNTVDAASGALTTTMVHNAMQAVYDVVGSGGLPDTIICNSWVRRKLSTLFATTNVTTYRAQEEREGGVKVDCIITDFGTIDILLDPYILGSDAILIKKEKVGIGPLRGRDFKRVMLAKTGPSDKWMIEGAYTLQVRASGNHALIKNISVVA